MNKKKLKGERKWTYYTKKILEDMINTDKELNKHKYKIYCDTDEAKKTLSAVVSLNKYIKCSNNEIHDIDKSINDFTNNKFHPDILITEDVINEGISYSIPRLVIESKYNGTSFTPHEILAYNYKADLHKKLYPGLRYGLIIGNSSYINNTTIRFGNNFDFILSLSDEVSDKEKEKLMDIVKKNLDYATKLESIIDDKNKSISCVCIENNIEFEDIK